MSRIMSLVMCVAVINGLLLSTYCEAAAPPKQRMQVGRYQLVVGQNGYIYVIDTATAQCWIRSPDLRWTDMGKPFDPKPRRTPKPLTLKLPNEPVELTILQRRSKPIPGSEARILLQIGDITAGQVLLSVRSDDGEVLLDDTSVKPGEMAKFAVGDKTFYIRLHELTNVLLGDNDFGVFEIWSNSPPVQPASEGDGGSEKPGDSDDPIVEDADAKSETRRR